MKQAPLEIKWKQGSHIKTRPEVAYKALEKIRRAGGGSIAPEAVVDASRPKSAPLHKEFEWDDSVAAEQYRVNQARYIVRSIEVKRVGLPAVQSRAYEATVVKEASKPQAKPRSVYQTTEDILRDPVSRAELLTSFVRDIQALRRRYAALSELALVWTAVDKALDGLAKAE